LAEINHHKFCTQIQNIHLDCSEIGASRLLLAEPPHYNSCTHIEKYLREAFYWLKSITIQLFCTHIKKYPSRLPEIGVSDFIIEINQAITTSCTWKISI
jgi:hypothetical protein